jgi:hypothetical protein
MDGIYINIRVKSTYSLQTTTQLTMSFKTFNLDNVPPKLQKIINVPSMMKIPLIKLKKY